MILYSIKPKLRLVQENLRVSQSNDQNQQQNISNYRLKPNQFKKEQIDLLNIPVLNNPYRIPGTKIGIKTSDTLNKNKLNPDDLNQLLTSVQLAIDVVKRACKPLNKTDLAFEGLEINEENMAQMSHKQSLALLNELADLRGEIRKTLGQKDQWVELINTSQLKVGQETQTQSKQQSVITKTVQQNQTTNQSQTELDGFQQLQSSDLKVDRLTTQEVNLKIENLKQQAEPTAPPPENIQNRPLSLTMQQQLLNQHQQEQNAQKSKNSHLSTRSQQIVEVAYPDLQPYRNVRDFKTQYESEYLQEKLLPKQPPVVFRRDFVKENIVTQQFYRRGIVRKVNELGEVKLVFDQGYEFDRLNNPQMDELLARIQNQQLQWAGKGKSVLQGAQQQALQQVQQQTPQQQQIQTQKAQIGTGQKAGNNSFSDHVHVEKCAEQSKTFKQQIEKCVGKSFQEEEERVKKMELIMKETILQNLSKKLQSSSQPSEAQEKTGVALSYTKDTSKQSKSKMVKLPQFFQEYVDDVKAYKKDFQEYNKQEFQWSLQNSMITIDRNAPDFKDCFRFVCDQILQKEIDEQIAKAVAELVQ